MSLSLAARERSRLAELERVVEHGLATFVEVGLALAEIRDARLYRETHETFERYLAERWGLSRSRGYRMIEAAKVAELVSPMGDIQNERQARELVPVLRDAGEQAVIEVWRELRDRYGDDITAERVRQLVCHRMRRIERKREAQRIRAVSLAEQERMGTLRLGEGIDVHHGDFRELELEPGSVDLIFTDPPYVSEFRDAWAELGAFAARALKPGRLLVAYTGNVHFPDALRGLSAHLAFVAIGSVFLPGGHALLRERRVFATSKPLLFMSAGTYRPRRTFRNGYWAAKAEKQAHVWQQEAGCARYYVETLTDPGELVVDPFLGSGTTALVCRELGRRFVGCDVDAAAIETARARLAA
jgi:SAM-dependent methyltransferase